MSKKAYYVRYGNFSNQYDLAWADTPEDQAWLIEHNFERVGVKRVLQLARREAWRRKWDEAFSGYANAYIYPAKWYVAEAKNDLIYSYGVCPEEWLDKNNYKLNGRIWDK